MNLFSRRAKLSMIAGIVLGAGLGGIVNFTDVCRLEKVTLNGDPVDDWPDQYGVLEDGPIVNQPLDSLAKVILAQPGVFKVDLSCSWPHALNVRINDFTPACFLLDEKTGDMYGLDNEGRLLPMATSSPDWECPVLTGVKAGSMFSQCDDVRVRIVVAQLEELRDRHRDIHRLIDEIQFDDVGFLKVSIAGLPYSLKLRPERLLANIDRFVEFVTKYGPDLTDVTLLDMRYENMIVCAERR